MNKKQELRVKLKAQEASMENALGCCRGIERLIRLLYECDNFRNGRVDGFSITCDAELSIMGAKPELWIDNIKAQISQFLTEVEAEISTIPNKRKEDLCD